MWKHTEPTKICMYHAKWRNKNCNLCHEAFILGDDFKEETINVVILLKYWELVTPSFEIEQYLDEFNFISLCTPLCQNCFFQVGLSWDTWNTFSLKSMKVKILHFYNGYINSVGLGISKILRRCMDMKFDDKNFKWIFDMLSSRYLAEHEGLWI